MACENETFFMVYGDNQGAPTVKHESLENAEREARRLADRVPGVRFFVLQAIGFAKRVEPVEYTRLHDYVPF